MVKKIAVVFIIALILRFWSLGSVPSSLSMDEIAVGYDSYSVLKTGRDQHGIFLPLSFKSVGDYKAPVAFYLTIPSILVFGQTELAVRAPAALAGAATAVILFLLTLELGISKRAAFLTGIWFAVNPWHVYLSRTSFDGIIALFFLMTGLLVFLKAVRQKRILLLCLSAAFMAISVWSYHAERVFIPLLAIFLVIYFKPRKLIAPFLVIAIFAIPFVYTAFSGQGIFARAGDLWIGRDPGTSFISQYLKYFDFNLWFSKGLNLTLPGYPDSGFLYFVDFPVFLLGAYTLFKSKNRNLKAIALFWFLTGPLPAALTRGGINPGRTIIWLPFFGLVMAEGFEKLMSLKKKILLIAFYLLFLGFNLLYFLDLYKYNFPKHYADLWHYGYKEAAIYSCANRDKYDKIIITDKYGIELPSVKTIPYLYVLFYCQVDPKEYLANRDILNIEFRQPQWRIDSKEKNYLLIGSRWDFPEDFDKSRIMKTVYFPESAYGPKAAFYFVETNAK